MTRAIRILATGCQALCITYFMALPIAIVGMWIAGDTSLFFALALLWIDLTVNSWIVPIAICATLFLTIVYGD